MSFDPLSLFLSLIPSGMGFVLFVYGRKQQRLPHLVAGLLMMVYPYFTSTVISLVGIGVLIGVGLWWTIRLGW